MPSNRFSLIDDGRYGKIYLSGKMSGLPDHGFGLFQEATDKLRKAGLSVLSPHELDNGEVNHPWEYFLKRDLKALMDCNSIVVLNNWTDSRGAKLEVHVARQLKMPVYTYPGLKLLPEKDEWDDNPLNIANKLVDEDRQESYGHPSVDMGRTAQMWSAVLGIPITAMQVCVCMILVKISRHCNKVKFDNLADMAGYTKCLWMIIKREQDNAKQTKT